MTTIARPHGHWTRTSSLQPTAFKSPTFWHSVGYKPKTTVFLGIGSGKTSFFFSYSSKPVFFRSRSVFCPTYVHLSYWPYWHSCWSGWSCWPSTTYVYRPRVIYRPLTTTVYVPQTTHVQQPAQQHACPYTERQAWELLASGVDHLNNAVNAFHCLAEEHPYESLTLIGYSIVTAHAGDYERAAKIMRHAVRVDAEALRHVPADARIDNIIIDLIGGYSQLVHSPGREIDSLFMIAALRTILPDAAAAHFAVTQALQQGDQDASAFALRDLLTKMLHEELFPGP